MCPVCKEGPHWSRGISPKSLKRLWFNMEADKATTQNEPDSASLFHL